MSDTFGDPVGNATLSNSGGIGSGTCLPEAWTSINAALQTTPAELYRINPTPDGQWTLRKGQGEWMKFETLDQLFAVIKLLHAAGDEPEQK